MSHLNVVIDTPSFLDASPNSIDNIPRYNVPESIKTQYHKHQHTIEMIFWVKLFDEHDTRFEKDYRKFKVSAAISFYSPFLFTLLGNKGILKDTLYLTKTFSAGSPTELVTDALTSQIFGPMDAVFLSMFNDPVMPFNTLDLMDNRVYRWLGKPKPDFLAAVGSKQVMNEYSFQSGRDLLRFFIHQRGLTHYPHRCINNSQELNQLISAVFKSRSLTDIVKQYVDLNIPHTLHIDDISADTRVFEEQLLIVYHYLVGMCINTGADVRPYDFYSWQTMLKKFLGIELDETSFPLSREQFHSLVSNAPLSDTSLYKRLREQANVASKRRSHPLSGSFNRILDSGLFSKNETVQAIMHLNLPLDVHIHNLQYVLFELLAKKIKSSINISDVQGVAKAFVYFGEKDGAQKKHWLYLSTPHYSQNILRIISDMKTLSFDVNDKDILNSQLGRLKSLTQHVIEDKHQSHTSLISELSFMPILNDNLAINTAFSIHLHEDLTKAPNILEEQNYITRIY